MTKRIALAVIAGVFLIFNTEASMVSFYVIETGLPENGENNQHSQRWESAFMDVFFDAGYIVSNAPILRLESRPSGDIFRAIRFDIEEARSLGIDYVLITQLDFPGESNVPGEVSFFIHRIDTGERILERRIAGRRYGTSREEIDDMKTTIRGLVPYIGGQ